MQGLDIETYNPETGEGELDPEKGGVRLVQIRDGERGRVYDGHDPAVEGAIRELDQPVAHNATFEYGWIKRHYGIDLTNLHDTMIMSQVYYTGTRASKGRGFSHSLQNVLKRQLKVEIAKDEPLSDWSAMALTREQLEYAARDAKVLPALAATLMRKITRAGLSETYELERRVSHAIAAMQERGVAVHRGRLEAMTEEATEEAERLKAELAEEWGISPGSGKQLREHFALNARRSWPKTKGKIRRRVKRFPA